MVEYRDDTGKRHRVSTGERDRAKAEEEAQRIVSGKSRRTKLERWTLARALEATQERVWEKQASARHSRYMVAQLARSALGRLEIGEVTYPVLVDWTRREIARGSSPATVNRKLAKISRALNEMVREGVLATVPPMPQQREDNERVRWLTREEEVRLFNAIPKSMYAEDAETMTALLTVLIDTGGRLTETCRAIHEGRFTRQQITLTNRKSRGGRAKSRSVPLTARAYAAANKLHAMGDERYLDKDWCWRQFAKVRVRAGLEDVTLHTCRHTCASRLVQGGMDLYRVKEWLGHSSITVTERYAHLAPSSLDHGTNILEQAAQPRLRSVK